MSEQPVVQQLQKQNRIWRSLALVFFCLLVLVLARNAFTAKNYTDAAYAESLAEKLRATEASESRALQQSNEFVQKMETLRKSHLKKLMSTMAQDEQQRRDMVAAVADMENRMRDLESKHQEMMQKLVEFKTQIEKGVAGNQDVVTSLKQLQAMLEKGKK
jgi:archaellum component FlaC